MKKNFFSVYFILAICSLFSIQSLCSEEIKIQVFKGKEIAPYVQDISELRLDFFRNYPYLYDGEIVSDKEYVQMYPNSEHAILVVAKDNEKVIGVVTGLPMDEAPEDIKNFIDDKKMPSKNVFYLGEIVLNKEYAGDNLENKMYNEFERTVKNTGNATQIYLFEIETQKNDPRKPSNYVSIEDFWQAQGFSQNPELITQFSWKEIGSSETKNHPMVLWKKDL